jgi:hypothetical protein
MSFPHLGGVLKLGFTSSFVPISIMIYGDFPLTPLILVITLLNRKTLFAYF